MIEAMLTTVDNPFNPFDDYEAWYRYDTVVLRYNTSNFLARVVVSSPELSDVDQIEAITAGIDEIVRENVLGLYRKVEKEVIHI